MLAEGDGASANRQPGVAAWLPPALRWSQVSHLGQSWQGSLALLGGGAWTLAGKLINAVALLALNAVLARVLPASELASYMLAFSAVTLLGILCSSGLDVVAMRLIAEARAVGNQAQVHAIARHVLGLLTASALVMAVATPFLIAPALSHSVAHIPVHSAITVLIGLWTAMNGIRLVLAGILRGFQAMAASALFEGTLANSLTAACVAVLYAAGIPVNLPGVLAFAVGCNLISGALALRAVARSLGREPAAPAGISRGELLALGLPMVSMAVVGQLAGQLPLWITAGLGSAQDAAVFGLGLQVSVLANLPFIAITLAGSPIAARLNVAGERLQLRRMVRWVAFLAAIPAAAAVTIMWLFGAELMMMVFGASYRVSGAIAAILCAGRLVQSLTGLNEMLLTMTGGERVLSMVLVGNAIMTAPACYAGFHFLGVVGVALASGSLVAAQGVVLALVSRQRLGFWPVLGWSA
jgi:O-antigen/teichoic acid export membrane protein